MINKPERFLTPLFKLIRFRMKRRLFFLLLGATLAAGVAQAQRPREDDIFWSRRIIMRIDLNEKFNAPLNKIVPDDQRFGQRYPMKEGMVRALMKAYLRGQLRGFDPNDYSPQSKDDVVKKLTDWNLGTQLPEPVTANEPVKQKKYYDEDDDDKDPLSESGSDDSEEIAEHEEDYGHIEDISEELNSGNPFEKKPEQDIDTYDVLKKLKATENELIAGTDVIIELVEDWMFDKNRSSTYRDLQYVRIMWVDPEGKLPFKPIVAFKYSDIEPILAQVQWTNPQNDAAHMSVKDALNFRNFTGIIVNMSGKNIRDKREAERKRDMLVEFEHHLWQY